jgi:hypothetical protein
VFANALPIVCGLMALGPGTSQDTFAQTMPAGPRESGANGDLYQQVARALNAGTIPAKDGPPRAFTAINPDATEGPPKSQLRLFLEPIRIGRPVFDDTAIDDRILRGSM